MLTAKRVFTLAILALGGLGRQAHLLAQRAADEATDGMGLPASRFDRFLSRSAARPLQRMQHLGGLAAVSGTFSLLLTLRHFFAGLAFLADFVLDSATWARRVPTRTLMGFGCSLASEMPALRVSSVIVNSPSCGTTAAMTSITQQWSQSKGFCGSPETR
jgi:hypothetical protein